MQVSASFRKDITKIFLFGLLSLFLVPVIGLLFTWDAEGKMNQQIIQEITQDNNISIEAKPQIIAYFKEHPISQILDSNSPFDVEIRNDLAKPFSMLWQFHLVRKISIWMLGFGVLALLIIFTLGGIAFVKSQMQYISLILGWRILSIISAVEVIIQGCVLVWLSFWITAFYAEIYIVKLIIVVAVIVASGIFLAVATIFKRPQIDTTVHGELVTSQAAPGLWSHLQDLAIKVGTPAPDSLIAGIDTNFYVTEMPLTVGEQKITGRTLFVSLPLLRILSNDEADAIFVHELAHLHVGDTTHSALLNPTLVQYHFYLDNVYANIASRQAFFIMLMYRVIFEFAISRENRVRENQADQTAVSLTSPSAIAYSLLKISAYAYYRGHTEIKLFEKNEKFENNIGISQSIASGLAAFARSEEYLKDIHSANVPHPFDSHPPVSERINQVGSQITEWQYGDIVTQQPENNWTKEIITADEIEARLWAVYEEKFAAMHEENLAYRYEPANAEEERIVVKYFPPAIFTVKNEKELHITYAGLKIPDRDAMILWDQVRELAIQDSIGGDCLNITTNEKAMLGFKTINVKLGRLKHQKEHFSHTLGLYYARHKNIRKELTAHQAKTQNQK